MSDVPIQLAREGVAQMGAMLEAFMGSLTAELERHNRLDDESMMSPAEVQLAIDMRREGLEGWVQQHPVGAYSADFYFPAERLVVEVDGAAFHQDVVKDQRRTEKIIGEGHAREVLRIRAATMFAHDTDAVDMIRAALEALR